MRPIVQKRPFCIFIAPLSILNELSLIQSFTQSLLSHSLIYFALAGAGHCNEERGNIAFLVDNTVTDFSYGLQKDFVKKSMSKIRQHSSKINAAVVLYNMNATVEMNLLPKFTLNHFDHVIDNLPSHDPCLFIHPRVELALQIASENIFVPQDDKNASQIAVVIGSSLALRTFVDEVLLQNVSDTLKSKGVRIVVVLVGDTSPDQQSKFLNITEENDDLILVNGFSTLKDFEDTLVAKICSAIGKF